MAAPTPNIHLLASRVALVEQRLAELENSYGETLYKLHRHAIKTSSDVNKILVHLNLDPTTDAEVDAVLEES